jgi:hypothetical protein
MSTTTSGAAVEPSKQVTSGSSLPAGRWLVAIALAFAAAWWLISYPPTRWRIPDELANVGALSPPAEQAKLRAVMDANLWKNSLFLFGLAGTAVGLVGLLLVGTPGNSLGNAIATLIVGIVAGVGAGALGLLTRRYLDQDFPIPLISAESRPLFCDIIVYGLISVILLIPIAVRLRFQEEPSDRAKAISAPFAGVLTGIIVPVAAALVLHGSTNTSFYPPEDAMLLGLWFGVLALCTIVMVLFLGTKSVAKS